MFFILYLLIIYSVCPTAYVPPYTLRLFSATVLCFYTFCSLVPDFFSHPVHKIPRSNVYIYIYNIYISQYLSIVTEIIVMCAHFVITLSGHTCYPREMKNQHQPEFVSALALGRFSQVTLSKPS